MGRAVGDVEMGSCMEGAGIEAWTEISGVEVSTGVCCGTTLARLGSGVQSGTITSATRLAAKP